MKNRHEPVSKISKIPCEGLFPENEQDKTNSSHSAPTHVPTAAHQQAPQKDIKWLPLPYARVQSMAANGLTR